MKAFLNVNCSRTSRILLIVFRTNENTSQVDQINTIILQIFFFKFANIKIWNCDRMMNSSFADFPFVTKLLDPVYNTAPFRVIGCWELQLAYFSDIMKS